MSSGRTAGTIWKFPIEWGDTVVKMPKGAAIIHAAMQGTEPCIWAVVAPDAEPEDRVIVLYETGHDMLPQGQHVHIGSFLVDEDKLVFHVFEIVSAWP